MKVHLITIEIGVVRTGTTQVETEGGPIKNLGIVPHDTHFMKRRLTIEEDDIPITQVTLDDPSVGQEKVGLVLDVTKIDTSTIRTDDVLGARVCCRTVGNECTQLGKVEGGDANWDGQVHSH